VHSAAEPEVGEQLDEIDAAHGGAVEQVLALSRRGAASATKPEYGGGPSPSGLSKNNQPRRSLPGAAAASEGTSSGFST
jgi:hypothetical protein